MYFLPSCDLAAANFCHPDSCTQRWLLANLKNFLDALCLFCSFLVKSLFITHHIAWGLNVSFAHTPSQKATYVCLFAVSCHYVFGLLAFLFCVFCLRVFQPICLPWLITVFNAEKGSLPTLTTCLDDNTQAHMLMPIINARLGTSSAIKWFRRSLMPKNLPLTLLPLVSDETGHGPVTKSTSAASG